MKQQRYFRLFIFIVSLIAVNSAYAAASDGWYVGFGIGSSHAKPDKSDFIPTARSIDRNDVGFKALVGYQIFPYAALEFAYLNFGKARAKFPATSRRSGDIRTRAATLDVVAILPIKKASLAIKAGAANTIITRSSSLAFIRHHKPSKGWGGSVGAAAQYNFTPLVGVSISYEQLINADNSDMHLNNSLASFNLIYNFG